MATERNNTALEFETMLRRHLKSGGAPVAACAGFEVDAASAYLEDALGKSARAHYESHLAGCAACRRHLIELTRLSQLAAQAETQPVAVADQAPAWVRWKATVAGWFDFSVWHWKWPTIGAAGTISAILFAMLGAQMWRQMPKPATDSAAVAAHSGAEVSLSAASPSPSPEASLPIAGDSTVAYSLPDARSRADARVPKPDVDPQRNEKEIAVVASDKSLNLAAGQADGQFDFSARKSATLSEAPQLRTAMTQGLAAPAPQSVLVGGGESSERQASAKLDDQSQPEAVIVVDGGSRADLTGRIAAPPEYNPMISDTEKSQARSRPQNGKAELQPAKSKWRERVMGFLPDHKPEPERKTPLSADDESLKPLTIRIRDKVFRFEQNMWIDQAYRPAVARWRVTKLVRGSKEYERVLADDPQLKEFFDQGPIIIVWKDKIYRVVGQ